MVERIHPDDFLIAMVHYLPEGRKCFDYSSQKLNTFLFKQKEKYPKVLSSFIFDSNGTWPTSEELTQAMGNLLGSKLIIHYLDSNKCHFDPACEVAYQRFVSQRIPAERLSEIEKIADAFDKGLGCEEELKLT